MNKEIERMQVIIEPYRKKNSTYSDLRLKVKLIVSGQEFNHEQIIPEDHFVPLFDKMMDYSKDMIKQAIKEKNKNES